MRIATLVISLVLSMIVFLQSCAVTVGGSVVEGFAQTEAQRDEAESISGAGGLGILAGLLWVVGAGLVITVPKASMWLYGIAALCLIGAGASGFSDAYIWAVASAAFALMSWRGIREKAEKEEQERARYQADIATAAAGLRQQAGPPLPPPPSEVVYAEGWYSEPSPQPGEHPQQQRFWDGERWTDRIRSPG